MDPLKWYKNWEHAQIDGEKYGIPEVQGRLAIRQFLDTVQKILPASQITISYKYKPTQIITSLGNPSLSRALVRHLSRQLRLIRQEDVVVVIESSPPHTR